MNDAPFKVGDRVHPDSLVTWTYTGLSGKPGKDKRAVRRYRKGIWILEVFAQVDPARWSRVASICTSEQDESRWRETRERLMKHRRS